MLSLPNSVQRIVPLFAVVTLFAGTAAGTAIAMGPPEDKVHSIARTPEVEDIPARGSGRNFNLVAHLPLWDDHQYAGNEPLGIPRGSNGDITAAGDCVYVGSFIGYQPPLIVDVSKANKPKVVGPVPDAVPGVGNGIEGIEASGDLLVIDQRNALGGLGFEVPEGLPARGLSIWDIGEDCRSPELVARVDFGDLNAHTVSLWRDPEDPQRALAMESFSENPDIKVFDLTGCPDECEPRLVAEWDLETQTGFEPDEDTHEAIFSTDGRRVYVSQREAGTTLLDSSRLIASLRSGAECDPAAPASPDAEGHCLTLLNPDPGGREDTAPPFVGENHHTPIKVPDRPYLVALQESTGPQYDTETGEFLTANCPGAFTRIVYVGEDEYTHHPQRGGDLMRGDLNPETVGVFALPEQQPENCGPNGWEPGTAALPAWFSPHDALVFPNVVLATYYGAAFRAIDISNPFVPVEGGHFFNKPVDEVRWASYGPVGETELRDDGLAVRRPAPDPLQMFAFSYPLSHNGYIIYADVHSGLYILRYRGPHAEEIPQQGVCMSGNPGAVAPGFEPCETYGQTNWGTPGQ